MSWRRTNPQKQLWSTRTNNDKVLKAQSAQGTWCESHIMAPAVCILNPSNGTHNCRPGGGLRWVDPQRQRTAPSMRSPDRLLMLPGRTGKAQVVEHDIDSPTVEDDDEKLSQESEMDDDQGSEPTADETVKEPTPRRKTRSQGKKAFNIPAAASLSDSEDEPTPPSVASFVLRHAPSITAASRNSFPPPQVRARQRSLRPGRAGDRLKTSRPSPPVEIRGGRADYDTA
jgi:hypothetical protein